MIRKESMIAHLLTDSGNEMELQREYLNVLHSEEIVVNPLKRFFSKSSTLEDIPLKPKHLGIGIHVMPSFWQETYQKDHDCSSVGGDPTQLVQRFFAT